MLERAQIALESGYDGIELWMHEVAPGELSDADRREAADRYGVTADPGEDGVAIMRSFIRETGFQVAGLCPATHAAFNWHDPQSPDVHASIHRTIDICAELSGSYLILPMLAEDADEMQTTDNLARLAEYAGAVGVKIGFEPMGHVASFTGLGEATALIERAGGPEHIGLVLDLFHFFRAGQQAADLQSLQPEFVLMVHLNNAIDLPREQLLGQCHREHIDRGIWDAGEFLGSLMRAGYHGDFSVEILNPDYWAMDAKKVALTAFQATIAALERARGHANEDQVPE